MELAQLSTPAWCCRDQVRPGTRLQVLCSFLCALAFPKLSLCLPQKHAETFT